MERRKWILAALLILWGAVSASAWFAPDTTNAEVEKLAMLLDWKPGKTVAEIGAGEGRMTVAAAQRVGPSGRIFSTELDSQKLAGLKALVARKKLANITVIEAGDTDTNLPAECCDSIFMRDVYHHFAHPTALNTSLFRALKPGGMLAVIDFPPDNKDGLPAVPGVPGNHPGHGVSQKQLIEELSVAGFQVGGIPNEWPGKGYCVTFRKP